MKKQLTTTPARTVAPRCFSSQTAINARPLTVWLMIALWGVLVAGPGGCQERQSQAPEKAQSSGLPAGQTPASTREASTAGRSPAREVLETMVANYRKATSYADHGTVRVEGKVDDNSFDEVMPFSVALLRPCKLRMEVYQAVVVCDGQQFRAAVKALPNQVLAKDAPPALTLKAVYSDRLLSAAMSQAAGRPPQLELLLAEDPISELLPQDVQPSLMEPERFDNRDCYRLAVKRDDGTAVYWIDRQTYTLRRVELPTERLRDDISSHGGKVDHITITADFLGAQLDCQIAPEAFQFEVPAGAELVKFLFPPHPAQLLGKKVPEFRFTGLDGQPIVPESLAGKITVVDFWATFCAPCRLSLPKLEEVYQKYKDNPKIAFLAVSVDQKKTENRALLEMIKELKVTIPILRDPDDHTGTLFMTSVIPTMFILGPDGVVQDYHIGINPEPTAALPDKLENLLAGKDIYEEGRQEYQKQLQEYQQSLEGPAEGEQAGAPGTQQHEIPRAKIAQQSDPRALRLKPLWKCTKLKMPGNVLVVPQADAAPRILVVDEWKSVAEVAPDGQVVASHDLDIPQEEVISFLRFGAGADGKRYFLGAASAQQQVHLFDDQWKLVFNFPPDALENKHSGIADAQLADLRGDGKLELFLGYWGAVGVQAVSLEGKRLWSNRSVENVLRVAVTGPDPQAQRSVLAINSRGTLVVLDAKGERKQEVAVGNRMVHWIVAADLDSTGQPKFCGLSANELGVNVALGLDLEGRELWSYELPKGIHEQPVELIVAGRLSPSGPGQWLLPGADGSIQIIAADGKLIDRFNYGATLSGLATAELDGRPVLLVASPHGLDAWQIEWPGDR